MLRPKENTTNKKAQKELIRMLEELSGALLEMNPGMAKKAVAKVNLEIAKMDNLRIRADKFFKSAQAYMEAGRYVMANSDFVRAGDFRREIGDETGLALALEMQVRCFLAAKMYMRSVILKRLDESLKIFRENEDEDGVGRIEALIAHVTKLIEEAEKKKQNEVK